MAVQQKPSEAGWFYHAPAKPNKAEPIGVPPASQIPGLSDLGPEPPQPEPMAGLIKETDSKYIRLAKMGGRQDLLKMRELKPKSNDPVGYPRVDWYYLEDNAVEDAGNKKETDWEFKLPDYMVHHERNSGKNRGNGEQYDPKRLPYGWDKKTAYERENSKATDKTVRIKEARPPGYGVRNEKATKRDQRQNPSNMESGIKSGGSTQSEHFDLPKYPSGPQPMREEDRPDMSKLLSFGYAADARKEREEQRKQAIDEQFESLSVHEPKESQVKFENVEKQDKAKKANSKQSNVQTVRKGNTEEKEPFKLSKFKKVSSRTESHR